MSSEESWSAMVRGEIPRRLSGTAHETAGRDTRSAWDTRSARDREYAAVLAVLAVALWASVACATILSGGGPRTQPPTWSDTGFVLDSVECAVERKFGAIAGQVMRARVVEGPEGYPLLANTIPSDPPTIIVRAGFRTALASPIRHEFFAHVVPHALCTSPVAEAYPCGSDPWNRDHRAAWEPLANELDILSGRCRREMREGDR